MDPLKMYFLLKMVMFHCYVSFPEGKGWGLFQERTGVFYASDEVAMFLGKFLKKQVQQMLGASLRKADS